MPHPALRMPETVSPDAIQEAIWRPDCPLVPLEGATYATYDALFAVYAESEAGKHQATQPPRFYAGMAATTCPQTCCCASIQIPIQ